MQVSSATAQKMGSSICDAESQNSSFSADPTLGVLDLEDHGSDLLIDCYLGQSVSVMDIR